MKKIFRTMVLTLALLLTNTANGQIEISTFKLKPTLLYTTKALHMSFTCKGEKKVKYVKVEWCAVNAVGDVSAGMTPNLLLRKVSATGPFSPDKKYRREAMAGYIGTEKVRALPVSVSVEYMDGTEWETDINKDNYAQFFPKLKWIDFTVPGEITDK